MLYLFTRCCTLIQKLREKTMPAFYKCSMHLLVSQLARALTIAVILTAPQAFAKKDLFAKDPASKQAEAQQLQPNENPAPEPDAVNNEGNNPAQPTPTESEPASIDPQAKPHYVRSQLLRLKGHIVEAKNDLFGSKEPNHKADSKNQQSSEPISEAPSTTNELNDLPPPTISNAEAAQRALRSTQGQVMNVKLYYEEELPRYAVKLLQKNGRMKTIIVDGLNGDLIEDTPQ